MPVPLGRKLNSGTLIDLHAPIPEHGSAIFATRRPRMRFAQRCTRRDDRAKTDYPFRIFGISPFFFICPSAAKHRENRTWRLPRARMRARLHRFGAVQRTRSDRARSRAALASRTRRTAGLSRKGGKSRQFAATAILFGARSAARQIHRFRSRHKGACVPAAGVAATLGCRGNVR